MAKRVFLIVLDSFGIGAEPDAARFGDAGTNTLAAIAADAHFRGAPLTMPRAPDAARQAPFRAGYFER